MDRLDPTVLARQTLAPVMSRYRALVITFEVAFRAGGPTGHSLDRASVPDACSCPPSGP
jgi:hypothetical protein